MCQEGSQCQRWLLEEVRGTLQARKWVTAKGSLPLRSQPCSGTSQPQGTHLLPSSSYRPSRTRLALPRPLLAMSRTAPSPGGPSGRDHVVLTGPAGPEELWKLVWQHGTHVLVSGCPPDATEKPQEFWPTEMQPIVTDMVTVHWVAESSTAGWLCTLFRVTHDSRKEREVQRLQFPYLEPGRELPATNLLPFLAAVGQCCSRGNSKKPGTLLSCSSKGATQLGTFLAMEQLLQQAGSECTVDVFNVALQRSQACSLMTPTLLRGDQRRRG
ncbi:receptor-type tyrosine-protein phosphatase V-like isoform X6 [Macaca fascicularis]|uniref:receptor-type tyrosine-protein phosphatase V-like isoform X6 n=1 Tax=Macaca fascicularis TaxID=9541 RepID=UPI0032B02AC3